MSRQHRWLRREIERWRAEGLIGEALAATLAERYPLPEAGRAWGQLILSALGAGIAGLGVILFFAYNWEALPKFLKLGLVFASLIAAHGAALWFGARATGPRHLSEGLHVLGTMLFGAGIWLVAQIYHIDEHYPDGLFVWSLGALALAWALQSMTQGLLAVTLIGFWVGLEIFEFEWSLPWAPALVAAGVVPLAWLIRSRVLLFFGLLALVLVLMVAALPHDAELGVAAGFFAGILYLLAGYALQRTGFPEAAPVCRVLGASIYLLFLFVFSFAGSVEVLDEVDLETPLGLIYFAVPLALALLAGGYVVSATWADHEPEQRAHQLGALASLILGAVLALGAEGHADALGAIAFNLVFLLHAGVYILQGCREASARLVGLGCVMLTVLVLARFVDLFESLLVRSAVFVLLGATLFVIGNVYFRSRRGAAEGEP